MHVVRRPYAGWLTNPFWYVRSWANKAQIVRAILLASATIATFCGRRMVDSLPTRVAHSRLMWSRERHSVRGRAIEI